MQHSTSLRKKQVQLGLLASSTLLLTATLLITLGGVGKRTVQAQGMIYQLPDLQAQQSVVHQWITETVDTDGGWGPSVALDQHQKPHIAYQCAPGTCYAVTSDTQWVTSTVDSYGGETSLVLDTSGYPHISFGNGILKYADFNGTSWTVTTIEGYTGNGLGRNSALALDVAGHPHITYYGPQPQSSVPTYFRHAYYDGSQWFTQTVAGIAYGNGAGVSYGLLIDSEGHLHTLYDGTGVTYAYLDGSTWHTQTIASGFGGSLALASDGSPHASFISYPSDSSDWYHLKYASYTGSGWTVQEVTRIMTQTVMNILSPSGFVKPGATSLKFDSLGVPHIAFYNDTYDAGFLRYAYLEGSTWVVETVDTQGVPGWARLSLALDPSGYPRIAYLSDYSDRKLRYAYMQRPIAEVAPSAGATLTHTGTQSLHTTIQIPSGAVTETTELVFTERDYAHSSPAGYAFAGQGFQIEAYRSDGVHIPNYIFTKPITITVEYSNADIAIISDENTLELRYWNGNTWSVNGITIIERDANNNRLVATVTHLSQFAMFGETHQIYLPLVLRNFGM